MFDNGAPGHPAAAKEYLLDEINLTAELVWSYVKDSTIFSLSTGNVQRLENGNTLIDFGNLNVNISQPAFEVIDSFGQKVFEVTFADTLLSYRAFNFSSLPFQFLRPEISCYEAGGIGYLDAGVTYPEYLWNTGETTQTIAISTTGEYSVFVPVGNAGNISSVGFNVTDIGDPCNTLSSFAEQIDINSLEIFPNPGNGNFSISNYGQFDKYQLITSKGEIISSGNLKEQHNFSEINAGIYFLRVRNFKTTNTFRIIIM